MKLELLLLCFFILLSCANENNSRYLQQQEISISPPRIQATNTIIDSLVTVSVNLHLEGVEIFYTKDGTEPTLKSTKYKTPFSVMKAGMYKFKAFHPNWKPSKTITLKLYTQGYRPSKIKWHTKAHTSYPGLGVSTTINNTKGDLNFKDSQWLGFDSIARASLYFDDKPFIKSMTLGYLVDTASWIFPPEQITLYLNEKDTIHMKFDPLSDIGLKALKDIKVPIGKKLDSILVEVYNTEKLPEWHPGKGMKAWLFMDEWIFNE